MKVYDFLSNYNSFSISFPEEFSHLREFYVKDNSPIKLFQKFQHFGARWEEIGEVFLMEKPDIIGISSLFTTYFEEVLKCASLAKRMLKNVKVVVGGNHPSTDPEAFLGSDFVDFVVRGDGEIPFYKLLLSFEGKIPLSDVENLSYKRGGKIVHNPVRLVENIEMFHPVNLNGLSLKKYKRGNRRYVFIEFSRGCPFRCNFCSLHTKYGGRMRFRSPQKVVNEMEYLREEFNVDIFDFTDDYLIYSKREFRDFLKYVIESKKLKGIELCSTNGIPMEKLDREILYLMKRAGFKDINISLVSTNKNSLKRMNRPSSVEIFERIYPTLVELDFFTTVYLIYGLEGEDWRDVLNSIFYLLKKRVLIGPSILYATPGTGIYERFSKGIPLKLLRSSTASVLTENFTTRDLMTLFSITRLANFLKRLVDNFDSLKYVEKDFKKVPEGEFVVRGIKVPDEFLLKLIFSTKKIWGYRILNKKDFLLKYFERKNLNEKIVASFLKGVKNLKISGVRGKKSILGEEFTKIFNGP